MFPGLGKGMSPRKMQQMMKQMGISVTEIENVEEVIIRTADSEMVLIYLTTVRMMGECRS